MTAPSEPDTVQISFRITDPKVVAEFLRQLRESGQENPHLFARQLLTEHLLPAEPRHSEPGDSTD